METKKLTAVDWLIPKFLELVLKQSLRKISSRNCELEIMKLFEQAKQIEKEQIIDAYKTFLYTTLPDEVYEEYYNETYNN